jgi:D-alanyl-lipoteichoic acid acyltransferase DltB (MBOAT superfamily)
MLTFTSLGFLLALGAGLLLYRFCPVRARSGFLLLASYAYYCAWSAKAAAALAAATAFTFFAGRWAGDSLRPHRARIAGFGAAGVLASYLIFCKIAAVVSLPRIGRLALPLGVSYYSFKLISYLLDVYWAKIKPERRFVPFATYAAFFPQILAGPIQRPGDFLAQMPPRRTAAAEGLTRLVWGLVKKLAIADQLSPTVNYVYGHMQGLHGPALLAGFYLFPLQLYADFSGLTDIAIGAALLFGIASPENFRRPFIASTITDFWRRWHISLTSWLGDYLFTPLRMATRAMGNAGLVLSITVNTVAIGLWHGFGWGFLIFGLMHSGYLAAEALSARQRSRFFKRHPHLDGLGTWLGRVYVFHAAAIAFLFFRASNVRDAFWGLTHLLSGLASPLAGLAALSAAIDPRPLAIGLAGCVFLEFAERFRPDEWLARIAESWHPHTRRFAQAAVLAEIAIAALLLLAAATGSEKPFIYGGF